MVFWLKPPGLQNVPKHVLQAILRALDISIQTSADEADATLSRQLNSNTRALQIAVRDKILQLVENYKAAIRRTISISEDPLYIQVKGSVNRLARVFRILHDRISNTTPGDTVLGGFDERGQYVAEGRPPGATAVAPSMGDLPPNYSAANNGLAAFEPPPPRYAASQRAMAQGHHTSVRGGPPTSSRPTTYASVAATSATAATSTMARPTSAAPSPRQGPLPDLIASTGPNGLLRHTAASTATGPPLVSSGARVPTSAPHPMMGSQANIGIDPFANLALIGNSMGPVSYPSGPFVAPRTAQDISHPLLPNANYTVPERPSMTTTQPTPGPPITTPQVEVSQALPVASNYGPWPFTPFDDGLAWRDVSTPATSVPPSPRSQLIPGIAAAYPADGRYVPRAQQARAPATHANGATPPQVVPQPPMPGAAAQPQVHFQMPVVQPAVHQQPQAPQVQPQPPMQQIYQGRVAHQPPVLNYQQYPQQVPPQAGYLLPPPAPTPIMRSNLPRLVWHTSNPTPQAIDDQVRIFITDWATQRQMGHDITMEEFTRQFPMPRHGQRMHEMPPVASKGLQYIRLCLHQTVLTPYQDFLEGRHPPLVGDVTRNHKDTSNAPIFNGEFDQFSIWQHSYNTILRDTTRSWSDKHSKLVELLGPAMRGKIYYLDDMEEGVRRTLMDLDLTYGSKDFNLTQCKNRVARCAVVDIENATSMSAMQTAIGQLITAYHHETPSADILLHLNDVSNFVKMTRDTKTAYRYHRQAMNKPKEDIESFLDFLIENIQLASTEVNRQSSPNTQAPAAQSSRPRGRGGRGVQNYNRGRRYTNWRDVTNLFASRDEVVLDEAQVEEVTTLLTGQIRCFYNHQPHVIRSCPDLAKIPIEELWAIVCEHGLCEKCLRMYRGERCPATASHVGCNRPGCPNPDSHHWSLHEKLKNHVVTAAATVTDRSEEAAAEQQQGDDEEEDLEETVNGLLIRDDDERHVYMIRRSDTSRSQEVTALEKRDDSNVCMVNKKPLVSWYMFPCQVSMTTNFKKAPWINVGIDTGADTSIIERAMATKIKFSGKITEFTIRTVTGKESRREMENFVYIRPFQQNICYQVYVSTSELPPVMPGNAAAFKKTFPAIRGQRLTPYLDEPMGLLLGFDHQHLLRGPELKTAKEGPTLKHTKL